MKISLKHTILAISFLLFTFCATTSSENLLGGTEIGNPPISEPRMIVGSLELSEEEIDANIGIGEIPRLMSTTTRCDFDEVRATSFAGISYFASIDEDCSFALEVEVGFVYYLEFLLDDVLQATLDVDNNTISLLSPYFAVSVDESDMDLGLVTIVGTYAYPENQPASQNDQDGDGISDAEDDDDDNDGIPDDEELDSDGDGIPDDLDDDYVADEDQGTDIEDDDGDGVANDSDNCPDDANVDQADQDGDGEGDACDDSDGDGVMDDEDNCIDIENADQTDTDSDGDGDECDDDDDGDGILDDGDGNGVIGNYTCHYDITDNCDDNCQFVANPDQNDGDGNGIGDDCESQEI